MIIKTRLCFKRFPMLHIMKKCLNFKHFFLLNCI